MAETDTSPWKTTAEAAKYAKRHQQTIATALRNGILTGSQGVRKGKWLIHVDELDGWIREGCPSAPRAKRVVA